jgi:hypothetical protein
MAEQMEWVSVRKFRTEPLGAIGLLSGKVVMVVSFHEDGDANRDGKVSIGERAAGLIFPLSLKGSSVTEVAMQGRADPYILEQDPGFHQVAMQMFLNFATGLVIDGIYAVYFARGVSLVGGSITERITADAIKGFAIRKGFEASVKAAFMDVVGR